ncbi:hypothetical protein [Allorhodopirellula solitaria]|uniref:DUF2007 domain-containing protein n=1 Tax=Allorhodopirellula solitaria TaxID=2527987 RepID=A0A5C5X115_9BACT|nr:hypothetical protein [Allorhodopirellula solitaria]TWT56299.1 hypothetical protein CA85_43020 [Allorhodopirellula solitaria]
MTLPEPTTIYRSRSYPAADSLVAFLLERGVKARLIAPANEYSQVHAGEGPVFGTVYDVCAVDCTQDDIRDLLNAWHERQSVVSASTDLFCYHCGELLDTPHAECPRCGKLLEFSIDGLTPNNG